MEIINVKCRKIKEEDLRMIMDWRMMPEITQYLSSNPKLTMEGQHKWFENIKKDEENGLTDERKSYYWVLEVDGVPSGLVSLVNADYRANKIETGAYVAVKEKRSIRLAVDIQWNLYAYAFDVLKMHKVCEEVFEDNKAVNRILDMCGSKREGILRDHVYKEEKFYNVVVRGMLKDEWDSIKQNLSYNKFEFE